MYFPLLSLPCVAFWILIYLGRNELRQRTLNIYIGLWIVALVIVVTTGVHVGFFTAFQAILDAILVIVIFGGDIQIR